MGGLKKLFGGPKAVDTTPVAPTVDTSSQEADTTVDTQGSQRKKKGFASTKSQGVLTDASGDRQTLG